MAMDSINDWLAAGRPPCRLWVRGRQYDWTNARLLAHELAAEWSDRAFEYGCDPDGWAFVNILEKKS